MSTIAKALGLLDLFSDAHPRLGLSDVQRLTGRDKATVHRHLVALERAGFLEQDAATRAYRLGPALTRLSGIRARTVPEVEMVRSVIDVLSRDVGELVHVSRVQGFDLVHVHHAEEHDHPVRVAFDAYGLPPLFATASGKAYLAFSPGGLLELAIADPRTCLPGTPAPDRREIEAELKQIASLGYARNRDALRLGVSSVAIPVFDGASRAFATCSIAYPTGRGGKGTEARLARLLMQRGRDITEAMGGVVPPHILDLWTPSRERAAS
ncbi:IclR family transcriptional regulator [Tateyamaria omphalii]|uniref:IclR family transcriptional regulator n=1 Tax=Tateyamaria omphalii TaxID=299262 RepID=UPI001674D91B|nr:IclR family transcriptional regulator [Tateyamaria omphalii]GGX58986.1 IclR family transcriptional regulator [Tateyamaria omphalii]